MGLGRGPFIKEVILESFMSHEYSRVPLRPGINVITGPNGSGKSSILLGISVALGQTYTDRGERLSDLIRRGKDRARVTVILDNSTYDGSKPVPSIPTDQIAISRYIKKSGDYWHYVNNRFKSKAEVDRLLRDVGINPNNMLIIMHQNMIEKFAAISSEDRLKMVEDAVGASSLRERIMTAEDKLKSLLEEERAISRSLEEAKRAVDFWREEYEKLMRLRDLKSRKDELERELAWSYVISLETSKNRVEEKINITSSQISSIESSVRSLDSAMKELQGSLEEALNEIARLVSGPPGVAGKEVYERIDRVRKGVAELLSVSEERGALSERIRGLRSELKKLEADLRQLDKELAERTIHALSRGERIETIRKPLEIQEDIGYVNVQIASLGQVAQDAEDMYTLSFSKYRETEIRANELSENIKKASEEVEYRKHVWRSFLTSLMEEVEPMFNDILESVGAKGSILLRNLEDFRSARLEIYVGFRGSELSLLDAHTQSGGERIVATLAFLLALQKHIKSPFRAVDEFDVHLDPVNRERVMKLLTYTAEKDPNSQYIIITPGKVKPGPNMNIILVQSVSGRSSVSEAGGRGS